MRHPDWRKRQQRARTAQRGGTLTAQFSNAFRRLCEKTKRSGETRRLSTTTKDTKCTKIAIPTGPKTKQTTKHEIHKPVEQQGLVEKSIHISKTALGQGAAADLLSPYFLRSLRERIRITNKRTAKLVGAQALWSCQRKLRQKHSLVRGTTGGMG